MGEKNGKAIYLHQSIYLLFKRKEEKIERKYNLYSRQAEVPYVPNVLSPIQYKLK